MFNEQDIYQLTKASVGWATRCPRGSHSWDFTQLFLFSGGMTIHDNNEKARKQPIKISGYFLQKHNAKLFDKNEPCHNNERKIQFSGNLKKN